MIASLWLWTVCRRSACTTTWRTTPDPPSSSSSRPSSSRWHSFHNAQFFQQCVSFFFLSLVDFLIGRNINRVSVLVAALEIHQMCIYKSINWIFCKVSDQRLPLDQICKGKSLNGCFLKRGGLGINIRGDEIWAVKTWKTLTTTTKRRVWCRFKKEDNRDIFTLRVTDWQLLLKY